MTTDTPWLDMPTQGHNNLDWHETCGIASLAPIINHFASKDRIIEITGKAHIDENDLVHLARDHGWCVTETIVVEKLQNRSTFLIEDDAARLLAAHADQLASEDLEHLARFQALAGTAEKAKELSKEGEVLLPYSEAEILLRQSGEPGAEELLKQERLTRTDIEAMIQARTGKEPIPSPTLAERSLFLSRDGIGKTSFEDQIALAQYFGVPLRLTGQFVPNAGEPEIRSSGLLSFDRNGRVSSDTTARLSLKRLGELVDTYQLIPIAIRVDNLKRTDLLFDMPGSGDLTPTHRPGQGEAGRVNHAVTLYKVEWQREGEERVPFKFHMIDMSYSPAVGIVLGKNNLYPIFNGRITPREATSDEMQAAWLDSWDTIQLTGVQGTQHGRLYGRMLVPDVFPPKPNANPLKIVGEYADDSRV
ncbi:MAG: hypothetical protein J2P36_07085 [Ktedonobacteraceae bacterium]|nr:hypothetical protein [Ktedonobacteraceae bacterium]